MRVGIFDLVGGLAVACFIGVVAVDLNSLQSPKREIDISATDAEIERGFRTGVSWFGVYLDETKVGFARLARRKEHDGFLMRQDGVLDIELFGNAQRIEIQMQADLDRGFALRTFELALVSDFMALSAVGVVADDEMKIDVVFGDVEDTVVFPVVDQPLLDMSVHSLVLDRGIGVGEVVEFEVFDPLGLKPRPVSVEYLGTDRVTVVDGAVRAHRLRRSILGGETLDVWVNDLGEVLKEELPLGLVAVRETEALATWGFRKANGDHLERLKVTPGDIDVFDLDVLPAPAAP